MPHLYSSLPEITSTNNPKIKFLTKLSKRKFRDETGLFLLEGVRPLERFLELEHSPEETFICPEFFLENGQEPHLVSQLLSMGKNVTVVSKSAFLKIAYREHPEGILATAKTWKTELSQLKLSKNPLIIVLEAVEKPGNIGAVLRTADAVKADAVLICDSKTDLFNPNIIRSSTGTVFNTPAVFASAEEIVKFLKDSSVQIISTTPRANNVYTNSNLSKPTAIVMGAEDKGLSDNWLKWSDEKVRLPMLGIADSLNVNAATVAMCYEALRQRHGKS